MCVTRNCISCRREEGRRQFTHDQPFILCTRVQHGLHGHHFIVHHSEINRALYTNKKPQSSGAKTFFSDHTFVQNFIRRLVNMRV